MNYKKPLLATITILFLFVGCNAENKLSFQDCLNKAQTYMEKGNVDKAIYFYKKADDVKPNDIIPHLALARLYTQISDDSYKEAYEEYTMAILQGAKSSTDLNEELKKYGFKYQYKDMALSEYKEVLKIEPSNLEAMNYLALHYLHSKQYANAINQCNAILKYDNKASYVYWYLVEAYRNVGNYNKAIENLEKAYAIDKKVDPYQETLGEIYFKMKNYDKAFQMLTTLRNKKSSYYDYYDSLLDYKRSHGM